MPNEVIFFIYIESLIISKKDTMNRFLIFKKEPGFPYLKSLLKSFSKIKTTKFNTTIIRYCKPYYGSNYETSTRVMPPAIHYIVKAKLIRNIKNNKTDFLEFEGEFVNQDPIIAREQAFNHYQNYIDVLLESKNKEYVSDKDARAHLNSFINTDQGSKIILGDSEIDLYDSYENGLGIYLKIDHPIENKSIADKIGDEYLIHGIENFCQEDFIVLMDNLLHEFWYYQYFGYSMKDYKEIIHCTVGDSKIHSILQTPFNWNDYNKSLSFKSHPFEY